jgi:arabinogalactan endo-1,4-beta-galactosidase
MKRKMLGALVLGALIFGGGAAAAQTVKVNPIPDLDPSFIKGADVSSLLAEEKAGAIFYDEKGKRGDALAILKAHGVNWIRLRLWNDPKNAEDVKENGKILSKKGDPAGGGNNDLATDLILAKRAKALGLKWVLDFHYSDFWADPAHQDIPKAWKGLDLDGLAKALYQYTKDALKTFGDAGVMPDMVQIGNEPKGGMLWPIGKTYKGTPDEVIGGLDAFAQLLNAGSKAVREADPNIKVIIHLPEGGDRGLFRYMFDELSARDVDYDVIGFSYYPYWHGPLDSLVNNLNDVSVRYSRPVVVMETSYAYTEKDDDGYPNSFTPGLDKSSGYKASVQGQATEVRDIMAAVADVPGGQGLGLFYWEPTWIAVKGVGWRTGNGNNWENQAMFDSKGKALASMNVFDLVSGNQAPAESRPVSSTPITLTLALDQKAWDYPPQVMALWSDDAYRLADVTWTPIDRTKVTSPKKVMLTGVLAGTKIPATAMVNVVPMSNILTDASFESGTYGDWKVSDTAIMWMEKNPGNAHTGDWALHYWKDKDFKVTATKVVTGLQDGSYSAKIWSMGGGGERSITLEAQVNDQTTASVKIGNYGWQRWNAFPLKPFNVTGGQVTLVLTLDARSGNWGSFDDVELVREGDLKK